MNVFCIELSITKCWLDKTPLLFTGWQFCKLWGQLQDPQHHWPEAKACQLFLHQVCKIGHLLGLLCGNSRSPSLVFFFQLQSLKINWCYCLFIYWMFKNELFCHIACCLLNRHEWHRKSRKWGMFSPAIQNTLCLLQTKI